MTHWIVAKHVLRYFKETADHGLQYTSTSLQLNAFCDVDWVGSPDDCRSTSGSAIFLGNCLISWSVKKHNVVSRSSIEAKYHSLTLTTTELY